MKKLTSFVSCLLLSVFLLIGCASDKKPVDRPNAEQKSNQEAFIGEEKAKDIALEKAGLSASEVIFERTELDKDNGVWQYEVEFRKDRIEYSADIKADDGTILSFETDYDD
ncbi:MAG: PepSY domain-containing protein [Clostridia bacterium]|nr:PepSY domain-containing protein [Clostridia bacterium]